MSYSSTYSSNGEIPSSTYDTAGRVAPSFNLHGLTVWEAQYAIRQYALEKEAVRRRRIEQRKQHEAHLRRQGFDEEYIRTH